ncbi:sensor histidine kinase [Paenibacillus sp. B2(2019)]|uniref:sensor histidine kinase n=1 Tax=Paenibacillus sp. B2(2019) TaxID=2607754 RepID=UPI0011F36F04|nr:sensor histidine kinase [Paenibacillus sp. B2(2019)]KAA1187351.1 sensor histidine kinase [Paenibacillus sp. B2(2019)]
MKFSSIKTKLFLALVLVSVIPIVIVTYNSYRSYTNLVNQQTSLVASNTIHNTVKGIEDIFGNIERISLTIQQQTSSATAYTTVSDELKKLASTSDSYDIFIIQNKLKLIFENLLLSYDYVNGIYLFSPDGKNISYGSTAELKVGYVPLQDAWYQKTIANKGQLYIGEPGVKPYIINSEPSLVFSRALYDMKTQQFLGVFMLDCSLDIFKGLNQDAVPNMSYFVLANDDGNIIYDSTGQNTDSRLPEDLTRKTEAMQGDELEFYNENNLTVIQRLPVYHWTVIANISLSELYEKYGISNKLILYISLTCAVIFILLSILLSNWITKPITQLAKIMRKNKSQKFVTTEIKPKRVDEIGFLYTEYNKMMQDIDIFVRESYQNKILTMDSQMKALEAQINSHFLYNTLESINSIAEIEEVESIAVMTKALGDMFRYSIKTDSELVFARDEIQHVDNYMAIQQIRYGSKICFVKEMEDSVLEAKILKLILQPLVENAVYHGLENKRGNGMLLLKGYLEPDTKRIIFEIQDDGIGIPEARLKEIQTLLDQPPEFMGLGHRSRQSIGIKNVHSRIALYYGSDFGLTLSSEPTLGTTITLTLPSK